MATIYRFIVEQQQGSSGRKSDNTTKKSAKDKTFTLLSAKGGVEHNRKLRAINPVLNRVTGGYWEKGMRIGRAGMGLLKFKNKDGRMAFAGFSWTAIAILISFALQTAMKYHKFLLKQGEQQNKQNYKKLETGENAIHSAFKVTTEWYSGKRTYNENR